MSGLCRHGQITDIVGAKFVVTMGTSLLYFVDAAAHAKLAESSLGGVHLTKFAIAVFNAEYLACHVA